jgi:hypothetical protein
LPLSRPGFLGGCDFWEVGAHAVKEAAPAKLRERAVAMIFELRAELGESRGSLARVGERLGIELLRHCVLLYPA